MAPSHMPNKRVLAETTNTAQNIANSPSTATKKRKLDLNSTPLSSSPAFRKPGINGPGSSQPKSHFESEVLEKLSQNLDGLRRNNQERDQHWPRPGLDDFNPESESLVFQQIEAEEGTVQGGRTSIRLFGVTEVCFYSSCLLLLFCFSLSSFLIFLLLVLLVILPVFLVALVVFWNMRTRPDVSRSEMIRDHFEYVLIAFRPATQSYFT
jgi:hypothetical protein